LSYAITEYVGTFSQQRNRGNKKQEISSLQGKLARENKYMRAFTHKKSLCAFILEKAHGRY